MAMKRLGLALYAGVMVFALAACAVPEKMSNAPKTPEPVALTASVLAGTEWTAFAIDGLAEVVSQTQTAVGSESTGIWHRWLQRFWCTVHGGGRQLSRGATGARR